MKKLLKKLTVTGMAVIMAMGMTVSASAECSHTTFIAVRYGETHTSHSTHMHIPSSGGEAVPCTITTVYFLLKQICPSCGYSYIESHSYSQHSIH